MIQQPQTQFNPLYKKDSNIKTPQIYKSLDAKQFYSQIPNHSNQQTEKPLPRQNSVSQQYYFGIQEQLRNNSSRSPLTHKINQTCKESNQNNSMNKSNLNQLSICEHDEEKLHQINSISKSLHKLKFNIPKPQPSPLIIKQSLISQEQNQIYQQSPKITRNPSNYRSFISKKDEEENNSNFQQSEEKKDICNSKDTQKQGDNDNFQYVCHTVSPRRLLKQPSNKAIFQSQCQSIDYMVNKCILKSEQILEKVRGPTPLNKKTQNSSEKKRLRSFYSSFNYDSLEFKINSDPNPVNQNTAQPMLHSQKSESSYIQEQQQQKIINQQSPEIKKNQQLPTNPLNQYNSLFNKEHLNKLNQSQEELNFSSQNFYFTASQKNENQDSNNLKTNNNETNNNEDELKFQVDGQLINPPIVNYTFKTSSPYSDEKQEKTQILKQTVDNIFNKALQRSRAILDKFQDKNIVQSSNKQNKENLNQSLIQIKSSIYKENNTKLQSSEIKQSLDQNQKPKEIEISKFDKVNFLNNYNLNKNSSGNETNTTSNNSIQQTSSIIYDSFQQNKSSSVINHSPEISHKTQREKQDQSLENQNQNNLDTSKNNKYSYYFDKIEINVQNQNLEKQKLNLLPQQQLKILNPPHQFRNDRSMTSALDNNNNQKQTLKFEFSDKIGKIVNQNPENFEFDFNFYDFNTLGKKWASYEGINIQIAKSLQLQGTINLSNGEKFIGFFKNGNLEGHGQFIQRNGKQIQGYWSGNILLNIF